MAAFLEIEIGGEKKRIPLGELETIGRDKSNSIQLHDSLSSRSHAILRKVGGEQYYLLDGGSRNGSFVNDQRISTPTLLRNGDRVLIGETVMTFIQDTPEATEIEEDQTDLGETISFVRSDIRPVTILVADIRGYTSISEQMDIKILTKLMSKWFYEVQNIVEKNFGRVDKFIGDCVMGVWDRTGQPVEMILNCLRAACEIDQFTRQLGAESPELPGQLRVGAGINSGVAALGVGYENTVMGDTVNLAFRLESATKELQVEMVISQSSYQLLPEAFWKDQEKEISVKGRKRPVQVIGKSFEEIRAFLSTR
ncbi:MAG: FHA domain-containing protein [Lentisphaerae bacterium]|nr:MAG: FHA domain-containing protein [Lentisphaerota bacterium]